ncbi:MAG: glycosyltransferase family 39 protein [Rhizobiales bacterium]|nr:glycosyltransferase family 39 protein [Hyphomicrobiales bacterium]
MDHELIGGHVPRSLGKALPSDDRVRLKTRSDPYDFATVLVVAALVVLALFTFKDYAISNDEGVQHHYGELIIAYYKSGFKDQAVFNFDNLYLYGGLFDIVAVSLSHLIPIDPYDLRHLLCAMTGIAGIAAAAAAARMIAGPRAALIAAVLLSICGAWYGAMFNHTKDIPFAAAMMGAMLFILRIARQLPSPRLNDVAAFGLLMGAALGIRVIALLLVIYAAFVIPLYLPSRGSSRWQFAIQSALRMSPAFVIAYVVMIAAWPWAALAPLNPIRGLFEFSEFHYAIRTFLDGQIYEMGSVPPTYVPIYILIRVPLLMLFGFAAAILFLIIPSLSRGRSQGHRRDVILIALAVIFPLACQVVFRGPAFTGLRHFLFVIPPLAIVGAIGIDAVLSALARRGRAIGASGFAVVSAFVLWDTVTLARLHPYEYLFYNQTVGGLEGASRRYDLDYWFSSMPEALGQLEAYLRHTTTNDATWQKQVYSVAVCGERLEFDKTVTLPQLRFDFKPQWSQSEFFIAPTHMNCDNDLDGKIVGTVTRLGVPIAYIKDRRALTSTVAVAK